MKIEKFPSKKVYPLVSRVNAAIGTCQDESIDCTIIFLYQDTQVHSISLTIVKNESSFGAAIITDALDFMDKCDKIIVEVKGQSGFMRRNEAEYKEKEVPNSESAIPSKGLGGLGGLGGVLNGLDEISSNKTGLGWLLAKSESASEIQAVQRECDRQIVEIEREAEKDKAYLKTQLQDLRYSISNLEREKRERDDEVRRLKESLEKEKTERGKLEAAKKDFDTNKMLADYGTKLLGMATIIYNQDKTGNSTDLINQGALGLITGGMDLKAIAEPKQESVVQNPYSPATQQKISLLSSIGLFDRPDNEFNLLYNLLKMVRDYPAETFNNHIAPLMQQYGYIQTDNEGVTEDINTNE